MPPRGLPIAVPADRPLRGDEIELLLAWIFTRPRPDYESRFQLGTFFSEIGDSLGTLAKINGGQAVVFAQIRSLIWKWVVGGFVVPCGSAEQFDATESGRVFLRGVADDRHLAVIEGTLAARLRRDIPTIDEAVVFYADQSQRCFLSALYQPSVVMLGLANEMLVQTLFDALLSVEAAAGIPPYQPRRGNTSVVTKMDWLELRFRENRTLIGRYLTAAGQPSRWIDDLPMLLGQSNALRLVRNDSGHPSPYRGEYEDALGFLTLFPKIAQAFTETTVALEARRP